LERTDRGLRAARALVSSTTTTTTGEILASPLLKPEAARRTHLPMRRLTERFGKRLRTKVATVSQVRFLVMPILRASLFIPSTYMISSTSILHICAVFESRLVGFLLPLGVSRVTQISKCLETRQGRASSSGEADWPHKFSVTKKNEIFCKAALWTFNKVRSDCWRQTGPKIVVRASLKVSGSNLLCGIMAGISNPSTPDIQSNRKLELRPVPPCGGCKCTRSDCLDRSMSVHLGKLLFRKTSLTPSDFKDC